MKEIGRFRRVGVFCGSSLGIDPQYTAAVRHLGRLLAQRGAALVYGGGAVGLMGELADAALEAGGDVTGVITDRLEAREVGHDGISEMIVVDSLHARKMVIASLSDAFVAAPGGFGTMDELFEVVTWLQLGYHRKPVGLLNVGGFYDPLLSFLDQASAAGFIAVEQRAMVIDSDDPVALLDGLLAVELPNLPQWAPRV